MASPPQRTVKSKFISRADRVDWVFKSSNYVLGEDYSRLTLDADIGSLLDADNECSAHGRCPGDRTPPCGCHMHNVEVAVGRFRGRQWAEGLSFTPLPPLVLEPCTPVQGNGAQGLRTAVCQCGCQREIDTSWPNTKRRYHPECASRIRRETQRKATQKFREAQSA